MNTALQFSGTTAPRTRSEVGRASVPCVQRPQSLSNRVRHVAQQQVRPRIVRCSSEAVETETVSPAAAAGLDEIVEVVLEKPLGLKFVRGNDGGAYVGVNNPNLGNTDPTLEIGDKIVEVSASFGDEVWEAKNFGQVVFAIRTRNGGVYLKIQRKFGDLTALQEEETTEAEKMWRREQAGGNVGVGTREVQMRNYEDRKKNEQERLDLFSGALSKFKAGDVEPALIDFENVISLEPKKYIGDDFARVSDLCMFAQYNVACCYSALEKAEAGLESLEAALSAGFDDYKKVRTDPNLENLRKSEAFTTLINKFDEPLLNENAVKVLKGLFSFGKKDSDE
ncbi:hypothetical protein BSKO_00692 [Bryopsis sp. KO-2023]|nr:hypothetical protein BSKO_00692 [Bryopsis sp. KO-2023]